jgi:Domain of unknown function (DUF4249)
MPCKIITMLMLAVVLVTIQSCEDAFSKDSTINVPRQPERLVIVSNSAAGERFSAYITQSVDVLAPRNPNLITNALVTLFRGNTLIDTLVYNSSSRLFVAKNNSVPVPGLTYTLRASLSGLTSVESAMQVPAAVPIQSLTYRPRFRTNSSGQERDEIRFTFQDSPSEENYYLIKLRVPFAVNNGIPAYNDLFCVYSVDPDAETSLGGLSISYDDCIAEDIVMRDTRFNGRLKEVVMQVASFEIRNVTSGGITYRPILQLRAITPEYYRYYKSQKLYQDAQGNPFTEPITIYTNIREGYGIFAAYTTTIRALQ